MNINLIIILSFMLSFLIFGNYGIHLYFKNKRKLLFKKIGHQKFLEIKNIETEIYAAGKLSSSFQLFTCDVILFDEKLLIILRKKIFNMQQSIIQIAKNEYTEKLDGVSKVYLLEKYETSERKIKIKATQHLIVKAHFEINLNFKDNLNELKTVSEFINEKLK